MEGPVGPVFCALCAREAPYEHNSRSEGTFNGAESGQPTTDLNKTFFIHKSSKKDLKGHKFSHGYLVCKINHVPAVSDSVSWPPSWQIAPVADFDKSAGS
jgi:hypothetical protein